MDRLQEIEARLTEIRGMMDDEEKRGNNKFSDLENEVWELKEEKQELEARQRMMDEAVSMQQNQGEGRTIETFNSNQGGNRDLGTDSVEYRKAFMDYVLRGKEIPTELRDDAVTYTTDVGSVIPEPVLNRIVEKMEAAGMILPLVTRTAIKGGVSLPTSSVKPVATWVNEGEGSEKQRKTTGSITFNYHKLRCAVAVSLEVDTMALPVFESTLINNVVEAMTMAMEQAIISGDGNGKPKGILAETPEDGQALDVNEITYQTLLDAESALPLEYEANAVYCMTKKTFMQYQGVKDANGQPIARVNFGISGSPERVLLGRPVVLCNYIDSFTNAAEGDPFAFLFNFSDYILNTNYQMGVKKYEDNETDDMVTKAIMIADGKVAENSSLVVLNKGDSDSGEA